MVVDAAQKHHLLHSVMQEPGNTQSLTECLGGVWIYTVFEVRLCCTALQDGISCDFTWKYTVKSRCWNVEMESNDTLTTV